MFSSIIHSYVPNPESHAEVWVNACHTTDHSLPTLSSWIHVCVCVWLVRDGGGGLGKRGKEPGRESGRRPKTQQQEQARGSGEMHKLTVLTS